MCLGIRNQNTRPAGKKIYIFFSEIMQSDILLRITLKLILQLHFFFSFQRKFATARQTHIK